MEEQENVYVEGEEGSGRCQNGCCRVSLPQPKRPLSPVDYQKHEVLECFPCYYEATWPLQKLPFLTWLLRYNLRWLISDVIAGLTVGLMVVPQALAYANIANLPPSYGLYSAFMGCFVYVLFGTSKDITLGPTAILSLLTASLTEGCGDQEQRIVCALSLTFISGAIQLAVGILNLGFLVDFIPVPVISGFTSAAALTIALGQVKHLLGISAGRSVVDAIRDIFLHLKYTNGWDFLLGMCCIALVLSLKLVKTFADKAADKRKGRLKWPVLAVYKVIWLICTARNAVVVCLAGITGFLLTLDPRWADVSPITLINSSHSAMPSLHLPNPTPQICSTLGIGIIMAPLISFLESIAIAKAFARKGGYKVEPSQELVAIGMCNLASSFVGSYPVTGSFSRTAVNAQSGVRTPAAGILTGTIVLFALWLLSDAFHYIPSASLAAIIIAAVLPVVDLPIVWRIIKLKVIDVVPWMFSFFLTLFLGIEYGVPIAMGVYLLILLYRHARPRHQVTIYGKTVVVTMNGGWTYPGVNYILKRVSFEVTSTNHSDRERTNLMVFDCTAMPEIDFTIVQELRAACEDLQHLRISVGIVGAQPQVREVLDKAQIKDLFFYDTLSEVSLATIGNTEDTHLLSQPLRGMVRSNSYSVASGGGGGGDNSIQKGSV